MLPPKKKKTPNSKKGGGEIVHGESLPTSAGFFSASTPREIHITDTMLGHWP
jgi:hypothetical protein